MGHSRVELAVTTDVVMETPAIVDRAVQCDARLDRFRRFFFEMSRPEFF